MSNQKLAKLLRKIAAAYTLKNGNRFKIVAYERAADSIEQSPTDIEQLWKEKRLSEIEGIGATLADHIDELLRSGKVKHFDDILSGIPSSVFPLLDVPGIGPKRADGLVRALKLLNPETVIVDLLARAHKGEIARIEGFGEKSQEDIIQSIKKYRKGFLKERRMPLPHAAAIAEAVVDYLRKHSSVADAVPLGSLRRSVATIGDIDLGISTEKPEEAIEWFVRYPPTIEIIEKGPTGATILLGNGRQIDMRVQTPKAFGAMLQYFTGSKNHNIKLREYALKQGLSLSEWGIKRLIKSPISSRLNRDEISNSNYNKKSNIFEFEDEQTFYAAVGLPWMEPEIREDKGEIEAALRQAQGKQPGLPKLVELKDIKGDLHIHSNFDIESSHDMGSSSLRDILTKAETLGYEYIGISDHNPSVSKHTKNEILSIMKERKEHYEKILYSTKSIRVQLFTMLEVDIQPDGKLAYPQEAWDFVDAVIVSVHSAFQMDKKTITKRIISGLSHPKARILGHPTGRLLGKREGYEIDWEELFSFCLKHDKALEINSYPERLDLPDVVVQEAVKKGIKLVINTDSHDAEHMPLMRYGVQGARRGWAEKHDILNTMPYNRFKEWLVKGGTTA